MKKTKQDKTSFHEIIIIVILLPIYDWKNREILTKSEKGL
jgi:hypothetical protein